MAKLPGRPKTKRGALLAIGASLATVLVLGFVFVYFVLFPTSSPKPFKLTASTVAASAATVSTAGGSTTQLAGRWKVASGSRAGYRVREQLAFLPAQSDAVGRTSQITGEATSTESRGALTVTSSAFTVAVNTLTSDRSMRDEKIHTIGLESDTYPTATFVLSTPITLPLSALAGHVEHVAATGVLTLHGTSRRVSIPLEMGLSGSTIEAAGSITFPWSQFNMTAPTVGGFVTVTEKATMEFDLRLQRA
jgi:polyisoprenoid-binding protein YceI